MQGFTVLNKESKFQRLGSLKKSLVISFSLKLGVLFQAETWLISERKGFLITLTAWKLSKYGAFSGPYFSVFELNKGKYGPEKTPYLDTFHTVTS